MLPKNAANKAVGSTLNEVVHIIDGITMYRDKHQLIVIYFEVGLDGIGTDYYVEEVRGLEVNRRRIE